MTDLVWCRLWRSTSFYIGLAHVIGTLAEAHSSTYYQLREEGVLVQMYTSRSALLMLLWFPAERADRQSETIGDHNKVKDPKNSVTHMTCQPLNYVGV